MAKILVTGGAGFLGSHLCESLLDKGHAVVALDNLSSGSQKNIEEFVSDSKFKFLEWDIKKPIFESSIGSDFGFDYIYNLACPASPKFYQRDHVDTLRTCSEGIYNVLEFAGRCKARVMQASTSEVYGNPLEHPQTEEYWGNVNPFGPRSCYDEGKRYAEAMMYAYNHHYGVDIRIARIFNSYGPKMQCDDGRVVSNFIVQALNNEDITIYGDGSQTRSFCYCKDTVEGLQEIMNMTENVGPINVGNPNEISIKTLAIKICELTNSNSKIIYGSLPQDDPVLRKPDISKITSLTDWAPHIKLEKGLENTISYFCSLKNVC